MADYTTQFPGTAQVATELATPGTATGSMNASAGATIVTPAATEPRGVTTGVNDPASSMYADYRTGVGPGTMSVDPSHLGTSLGLNVLDPSGPISRPEGGRQYRGPWVDVTDQTLYNGSQYRWEETGNFKYNQMIMTMAQSFDPFMQRKEAVHPHWWLNRIPRSAYKLFDGTVHETRIYRGGLSVYSGLSDWEDLAPDQMSKDACAPLKFRTYQYAWDTRAWSGKRTAWGSDPICLDIFRFTPHAMEQLGWILETGVKFGTDIQNIWNRDMFIYHSVMAGRSYVMTHEFRGANSPRFIYEPYCKFVEDGQEGDLAASKAYVTKPFVVADANVMIEPLNFDVLEIFRKQLERQCPEAAVGRYGSGLMFALAVSEDDVWNHIRGNEELRKYWIEANPQALIDGWIAPTTYRRWTITCDGDQLRFKFIRRIVKYDAAEALHYGNVGYKYFRNGPVIIAQAVDPEYGARAGVNGAPVPEANPEYDLAELAIAPVFMNQVFTNQFVPDTPSLGHGTWFGPKKGLNGRWGWFNPQTKENIEQKVGNFYGIFEIVPKPETSAIYATSFLYRRCAEPLPSYCPAENPRVNFNALSETKVSSAKLTTSGIGVTTAEMVFDDALVGSSTGDELKITVGSGGTAVQIGAIVFESKSGSKKVVQLEKVTAFDTTTAQTFALGDLVAYTNSGTTGLYKCTTAGSYTAWDGTKFSAVDLTGATVTTVG